MAFVVFFCRSSDGYCGIVVGRGNEIGAVMDGHHCGRPGAIDSIIYDDDDDADDDDDDDDSRDADDRDTSETERTRERERERERKKKRG